MTEHTPLSDTGADVHAARAAYIDATHHLLATAWTAVGSGPEPDVLHTIAAALIDNGPAIPVLPTRDAAHQVMAAVLTTAREAYSEALTARDDADNAWHAFRRDVRRRAARAVMDKCICLPGTNVALREYGIEELRVEYEVELQVPVTVYVHAADLETAYHAAEQEVRDDLAGTRLQYNTADVDRINAEMSDESFDLDD